MRDSVPVDGHPRNCYTRMTNASSTARGMVSTARAAAAGRLAGADADLASAALDVLDANWLGAATRPAPGLYPHQWSWDSAFVALGHARYRPERAESELRALFAGQWRNGMLPH